MAASLSLSYSTVSNGATTATIRVTMTYYGNGVSNEGVASDNQCTITLNGQTQTFYSTFTTSTSAQTMGSKDFTITKTKSAQSLTASGRMYDQYISAWTNHQVTGSCTVKVSAMTSYTVSYNANGGSGAPASQTKWYTTDLTLSSTIPTRTGYTFNGWNTNSSGTGTNYYAGAKYSTNAAVTLYAKWTPVTYTVTYNANGGTNAPASQTKTYGVDLTLSSGIPTYSGYNFQGWSTTDTGGVEYNPSGTYTANSAVTLYAVWTVAYTSPSIKNAVAVRCDSSGNEKLSGDYVKISFSWNGGLEADGTINPATITVTGDATYSTTKTGVFSGEIALDPVQLAISSTGSAVVTVTDTVNDISATQTITLPQGGVAIHISKTERAVEFFGIADDNETGVKAPSMTEAELNAFLDSLNRNFRGSVDWVVEEGTSGIWKYRKWDSGIAECWGMAEISGLSWSSYTTGGIATNYNSSPAQIPMPTSLFTSIESINANTHYAGSNVGWVANTSYGSGNVLLTFIRNGTTGVMRAFINVKGRWK